MAIDTNKQYAVLVTSVRYVGVGGGGSVIITVPALDGPGNKRRREDIGMISIKNNWRGREGSIVILQSCGPASPYVDWHMWKEVKVGEGRH